MEDGEGEDGEESEETDEEREKEDGGLRRRGGSMRRVTDRKTPKTGRLWDSPWDLGRPTCLRARELLRPVRRTPLRLRDHLLQARVSKRRRAEGARTKRLPPPPYE